MPKRFNNLNAGLKLLRSPTAGPDDIAPDAPSGTILREYQLYKGDKKAITYVRAANSRPGNLKVVAVKPLSLPAADTTTVRIDFSARAETGLSLFGLTLAEIGVDATLNATDKDVAGFKPAKAICRNTTGTSATTAVSKITKRPYKTKANASYTIPLGRTDTNPTWGQMKAFVLGQVTAAGESRSVTFDSEVY